MPNVIDLDKTKEAYDYLAETSDGQAALQNLRAAFDTFQSSIKPDLNRGEFVSVLRGLVEGLRIEHPDIESSDVQGFALFEPKIVQGLAFQGTPTSLTRLGTGLSSPAINRLVPGGFVISSDL